jgi:hypothetical protein
MSQGKSEIGQAGGLVITDLLSAKDNLMSRKELIRRHWQDGVDGDMLDKLAVTLEQAGLIQQIQSKEGMFLKLSAVALEQLGQAGAVKK